jgi:hypothetical protein
MKTVLKSPGSSKTWSRSATLLAFVTPFSLRTNSGNKEPLNDNFQSHTPRAKRKFLGVLFFSHAIVTSGCAPYVPRAFGKLCCIPLRWMTIVQLQPCLKIRASVDYVAPACA